MKTPLHRSISPKGFSLIELIGVLAIIAIIAGVLAPNVLRSIENAAVRAEQESMRHLGESVKTYLREMRQVLPVANWSVDLAGYADAAALDIATNRRRNPRTYVLEPVANPTRAMIISSMRPGATIPTWNQINSTARFDDIWGTQDGSIPSGPTAAFFGGWNADNASFLVIQRINLLPILRTELQTFTVSLNNTSSIQVRCRHTPAIGAVQDWLIDPTKTTTPAVAMRPKDRLELFCDNTVTPAQIVYTHVFSASSTNPLTFTAKDGVPTVVWSPQ